MTADWKPRSGDILHLGRDASVQFAGDRAITVRVIRVHPWPAYEGWIWLDCYSLDGSGQAVEHRTVYVRTAGIRPAPPPSSRASEDGPRPPAGRPGTAKVVDTYASTVGGAV